MGLASSFAPEMLVLGMLVSPEADAAAEAGLRRRLESRFGPLAEGPDIPFVWTGYYDMEMGGRPRRRFASFARLVDPSSLASIKAWTNDLEGRLERTIGGRLFNLDPGLLSLTRFALATTKERPHRLPLADGIFGELTLVYDHGDYRPLPWTYPDWASEEYRAYLRLLRAEMKGLSQ